MNDLASVHEPLVLRDGTVIDPTSGSVVPPPRVEPTFVEVPTHRDAQRMVVGVRRRIADLPETPERLHPISLVLMYTLLGLSDTEIGIALQCTEGQIGRVKLTDAYNRLYADLVDSIAQSDIAEVRGILADGARNAARKIVAYSKQDEDKALAFAASRDVLDRSGNRPVDVVEHRVKMEGTLVIEHVRKGETIDMPKINPIVGDQ